MLFRSISAVVAAVVHSGIVTAVGDAGACKGALLDPRNGAPLTTITQTTTEVATVTVTLGAATTTQTVCVTEYTTPCATVATSTETPPASGSSSGITITLTHTHTRTITSTVTDGTLTITTTVTVPSGGDPISSGGVSTTPTGLPTGAGPSITSSTGSQITHTTTAYHSVSSGTSTVTTSTTGVVTVVNGAGKKVIALGSILSGAVAALALVVG
ncbi:hypothetical protein MFIFM68171_06972 [Madurella fahalii]|uniref:Uncharacterized protein n=1 Tax=Madurella fahalii TaxID=1157608 RepID=A0ABQ0GG64_9PEZI